jgi:hypothetical protein
MTYLQIVNRVLRRLREQEVESLTASTYSTLIADLVNEVKRDVENSWNWSALRTTLTATTAPDLFNYVLTGTGTTFRILDAINDTTNTYIENRPGSWFDRQFLMATVQKAAPAYYNFNGVNANGDTQVDIFPIPDGIYDLRFNVILPQAELSLATDVLQIPAPLVIEGTLARAISERGEDGGFMEQEQRFRGMLADYIAIEAGQRPDETVWYPS